MRIQNTGRLFIEEAVLSLSLSRLPAPVAGNFTTAVGNDGSQCYPSDGTWTRESNLAVTIHERASTGTGDRMDRVRIDSTKGSRVESAILGDGPQEQTAEIRMRIYSYQKEQMNDTAIMERGIRVHYTKPMHLSIQRWSHTHTVAEN